MATPSKLAHVSSPAGLVALSYRAGGHMVIALCGHLQPGNVGVFSDQLVEGSDQGNGHLVLDLHLVRSMHPLAMDVLEMAVLRAGRRGATIATAGAAPALRAVLDPLSERGLLIHRTVHEALNTA